MPDVMFRLGAPTRDELEAFLSRQKNARLSYENVGASARVEKMAGFIFDRRRTVLGRGEECFRRAARAIREWRMFELGWVRVFDPALPIEVGNNVVVVAHTLGLWAMNATRIVYVIDEPRRFGFGYGTLDEHVECGEERFVVEHDANDEVVYDLSASSRPHHPLVWLGFLYARTQQKRFSRESSAALRRSLI